MKNLFKTKYRTVRDSYNGYEAQYKLWWFPFWLQIETNTSSNVEQAKKFIENHKQSVVYYEE